MIEKGDLWHETVSMKLSKKTATQECPDANDAVGKFFSPRCKFELTANVL